MSKTSFYLNSARLLIRNLAFCLTFFGTLFLFSKAVVNKRAQNTGCNSKILYKASHILR